MFIAALLYLQCFDAGPPARFVPTDSSSGFRSKIKHDFDRTRVKQFDDNVTQKPMVERSCADRALGDAFAWVDMSAGEPLVP